MSSPEQSPDGDPHTPITPGQLAAQTPKRNRTGLVIAAAVTGVVVLIGVAAVSNALLGESSKSAAISAATPASTTVVVPTPVVTTQAEAKASAQQYAGVMNSPIKKIRETWSRYEENACALSSDPRNLPCALAPLTFDIEAQTVVAVLVGAAKPGVPAYIGQPPAEIEKLVADTLAAAQRVDAAIGDDSKNSPEVFAAVSSLMTVLDRWDPYT